MPISFRSQPSVKPAGIQPSRTGLIVPAAYLRVVNPIENVTLGNPIELGSDGRYNPYLKEAEIKVEGELGMLTRASITFVVQRDTDFETYTRAFLVPKQVVNIQYGWRSPHPGWGTSGQTGELTDMVIYDFSFDYASDSQQYTCTFKAMAATATIDEAEFAISIPQDLTKNLKFLTENWIGTNTEHAVTSMTELILAQAQTNESDPFDSPTSPKVVAVDANANAYVLAMPFKNQPDDESAAGNGVRVYVNLDYVINYILNKMIVPYHTKKSTYELSRQLNPIYKLQDTISIEGVEKMFSPNPLEVVFPGDSASSTYEVRIGDQLTQALTFDSVYTSGFAKCIDGSKLKLGNILISLDALIDIQKQVADMKDQKSKSDTTDESSRSNVLLSIKDFIKKISALINKNSGGLIDLVPYHSEDTNSSVIDIVDRNYKGDIDKVTPLEINNRYPGDGVTMFATIKAEVPKDAIAQNAYLSSIKGITSDVIKNGTSGTTTEARKQRINDWAAVEVQLRKPTSDLNNPRALLVNNSFAQETVDSVSRQIRQYIQNRPLTSVIKHGNSPYPLKLDVKLAGVQGFKFGDLITLKYMPFQYKDNVCFRVLRVTHKFEGMNWETSLETVCDLK